jgi:hypothetical protein
MSEGHGGQDPSKPFVFSRHERLFEHFSRAKDYTLLLLHLFSEIVGLDIANKPLLVLSQALL